MAKQVIIKMVDDLDGKSVAEETVEYSLDGTNYEIDLSSKNAEKLRKEIGVWIESSRKVGGRFKGRRPTKSSDDLQAIRDWANEQGMKVSSRGRISGEIISAYNNRSGKKTNEERTKAAMAKLKPVDAPEFSESK